MSKVMQCFHFSTSQENGKTMNIKIAASCILIGAALAPIVAQANVQDSNCRHSVQSVRGAEITARIKAKLAEEKVSSLASITIDTDANGAVLMCGTVRSEQEADLIIFRVHRIKGVTAVRSDFDIPSDK